MLKVENISFGYTEKEVLKNISFTAAKGDYIAVIGESGCGKSTLLEIIYGLLHIDKGTVFWNDEKLLGPNFYLIPGEAFMKYLPQDFDLMLYITVAENVGKNISSLDPKKQERIDELLTVVDMYDFKHTLVKNLSGGQKQRVAIAKVLAKEPELLLLDEPFSHIDNFRKNKLRRSLFKHLKSKNITCIVATHDATDALSFANEILVLRNGELLAKNTPEELYKKPANSYAASLLNEINEIPWKDLKEDKEGSALVYPNQIKVDTNSTIEVEIKGCFFKGSYYLIEAQLKSTTLYFEHHERLIEGDKARVKVNTTT